MKLLIDSNIVLDALMSRDPWARAAQALILAVAEEKIKGYITASSSTDVYYILRKHFRDKERAKKELLDLLKLVEVLDVYGTDCKKAFELPMPDYEDALLAYCGKRHKMDYIVTRDGKHFAGSPVKALTPDDVLKKL